MHGDRHGVLTLPVEIAGAIPAVAAEIQKEEQRVINFCRTSAFSVAKLAEVMKKKG